MDTVSLSVGMSMQIKPHSGTFVHVPSRHPLSGTHGMLKKNKSKGEGGNEG
jgi:hypothetical protein